MPGGKLLRRYAIARAALAAGSCAMLLPVGRIDVAWALAAVVLSVATVAIVYLVGDREERRTSALAVMGGDLTLALVMIPVTGAEGSPFIPLLYVAVIFAGAYLGVRPAVITAALATIVLHVALYAAAAAFGDGANTPGLLWGGGAGAVRLYTAVAFLFVSGVGSGYVGRTFRRRDRQLQRARRELQQRRLDTDTIVDSLSTGLISLTSTGRIGLMNKAALEILGIPEIPPDRTVSRVLAGRLEAVGRVLIECLETGSGQSRALVSVEGPRNGGERLIGLTTVPVRQEYRMAGVVGIFRDVTEIKAEEEELRRKERLASIGEVAAGIVHELRNILKPLSGTVELLEADVDGDASGRERVQLIRHECDALEAFLEQILEFAGDAPLEVERFTADRLLESVVSRVRANTEGARASLSADCAPGLELDGDRGALRRMLYNVALNCVQVTPNGCVELSARNTEDGIVIRVNDDGPGVDAAIRGRMFEPFFTTRSRGTGLGLAVAKRTVERHGGTIEVTDAEGGGASFVIALPRSQTERASDDKAA